MTPERVLLPKHLSAEVTGQLVLQEHLVVNGQVAVLVGLPTMIGAKVALPLLRGVTLDLCNGKISHSNLRHMFLVPICPNKHVQWLSDHDCS